MTFKLVSLTLLINNDENLYLRRILRMAINKDKLCVDILIWPWLELMADW